MSNIKVFVPHPDRLVRDCITGRKLSASGEPINMNDPKRQIYYPRRLKDGDVTQGSLSTPKASKVPDSKED